MKRHNLNKWLPYLAIVIAGLLIGRIIQPDLLERYIGELVNENNHILADGQQITYVDYNNDGFSEQFIYYHLSDNRQPVINQYSSHGEFQNVWYLDGEVVDNFDFIIGDYNNDNLSEVYVFSFDNNSLYLYGLLPGKSNAFSPEKVKICEFPNNLNSKHFVLRSSEITDLNNDGFGELVFSVNTRFSSSPRKIYAYDIQNKKLFSSPELGVQIVGSPIIFDINNDKHPEIFISTLNSTNQAWVGSPDQGLYSASVVLNSDLSYYFVPILYESRMSVTSTFPFSDENGNGVASLSWSLRETKKPKIVLLNTKGEIKIQKKLSNKSFVFDPNRNHWNKILLFSKNASVDVYSTALKKIKTISLESALNQVRFIDIDLDGEEEFIAVHNNLLVIYRNDFSHPVKIKIPGLGIQKVSFSVKTNGPNTNNYLSVQNENYQYVIEYSKNKHYWLNFLLYLTCVVVLLLLYEIIIRAYKNKVTKVKYSNEKFFEMQLDLIKSQLDPHFLFNALNSIAFSINKEDKKTAYSNLGQFSKFMRESLVSMDEFSRSLEEEIGYVKNYLTLEKFRFKEQFDYDFIISPEVNRSIIVPKLIIFSYTESALKKSVLPKEGGGRLEFTIDSIGKQGLYISISENGLHRNLEHSEEGHTTNMQLMSRIIDYFNSFNSNKIEVSVKDNGSAENPKGSTIEIIIPADYKYLI
ncbi:MAG: histidine kinase [Salinivirgaceae bacterium]|nr:histidine kinase [Salinivirgaceae bacterium]